MSNYLLLYTSKCIKPVSLSRLHGLAESAANVNKRYGITGVLIADSGHFLQVLEAATPEVLFQIYDRRICPSELHTNLKLHVIGQVKNRYFPDWGMRFCHNVSAGISFLHKNMQEVPEREVEKSSWVDPRLSTALIGLIRQTLLTSAIELGKDSDMAGFKQLTQRETSVLQKLLQGYAQSSIAEDYRISVKTVGRHIENIRKKLNCRTKQDLIEFMYNQTMSHQSQCDIQTEQ